MKARYEDRLILADAYGTKDLGRRYLLVATVEQLEETFRCWRRVKGLEEPKPDLPLFFLSLSF